LDALKEGTYEVCIDSSLEDGHLTYGEYVLKGEEEDEVLISCHACHPSLANDNLSGIAVTAMLAEKLAQVTRRYTYRFVFIPGTIGSITWLSRNEAVVPRIKHGLVVANVGDPGRFHYKKSRRGDAEIDRAVCHVLSHGRTGHTLLDFSPYGYDERQYCSPGFDLPVGSLTRTPFGQYPEYHTSADNLDFIRPDALVESLLTYLSVFEVLEGNAAYKNRNPKCEPQLGKRGLYRAIAGARGDRTPEMAMLWVLNLSDGRHSLLDIAVRSGIAFPAVRKAADALLEHELLDPIAEPAS
jgi:aminopeptidase-like protein